MLFGYRNKGNNISFKKKKNKIKIKTNLVHTFNDSYSSEISMIPNNLHLISSDSEINDKFNQFEESVHISSSHGFKLSNKVPSSRIKYTQDAIFNDQTTYYKPISIKPKRSSAKKLNNPSCSKENNLNWYNKVMDIFCDEKFNSFEERFIKEHIIEETITLEDSSENLTDSNNSLYVSCLQINSNKNIQNTEPLNVNDVITDTEDNKSDDNPDNLRNIDCELSQLNQLDKSSANISVQIIQNKDKLLSLNNSYNLNLNDLNEFCTDSLDNILSNTLSRNIKPDACANFNQTSPISIEDVSLQHNDSQFVSDSECPILTLTNTFSDITIDDKIEQKDKFIIEEIELNELGQSFHLTIDKSEHEDDTNSNESSSSSQSISSAEQNCTVICLQNSGDIYPKKNNSNSNIVLLNDENVSLKNCCQYSSGKESLKCNNDTKLSKERLFDSNQNLSILNDEISIINTLETSKVRRKRYASRFQSNLNLDTTDEVYNSTQKYQNHSESICFQQNTPGFHLEPGKKWRRSIIIVRNFIDQNLDLTTNLTQNITKGRKWTSTVDDVLRQQSISNNCIMLLFCIIVLFLFLFSDSSMHQSIMFRNSMCRSSQRYSERNFIGNLYIYILYIIRKL